MLSDELYECIPNVSEGRDPVRIERLATVLDASPAALLHHTSDADHHRSVFTLAGTAAALTTALDALFEEALTEIDLRRHRGVHPRIGAVDVVPFVPLPGATAEGTRALAWQVGEGLGRRFDLPVVFYGEAARHPANVDLAAVRRGGLDGLALRLARDGSDAGPSVPHPTAGATAVGSRFFLVAFNVVLATDEVRIARRIAAQIREARGGLPGVKALGLRLASRGLTQVSMNLVDYRKTSPHRVVDAIAHAARRLGVDWVESELIGLAPRAALTDGPIEDLRLVEFSDDRVLENRLAEVGLAGSMGGG